MATEEDVPANQQALQALECSICNEEYGEDFNHVPRILRCGHTHCTKCLQNMMTAKGVKCPICLQLHPINFPDITQLPPNVTLFEILKTRRDDCQETVTQKPLCEVCHERPTAKVCIDCQPGFHFKFCEVCDQLEHERNFGPVRRHRRFEAHQVPTPATFVPCSRHTERMADFYSALLDEFACTACEVQSDWQSRSENFEPIKESAKKFRDDLERLFQTGRSIIASLASSKAKIDAILYQLGPSASAAKANISSQFADIINQIQARQQKLLKQVDVECANRAQCLEHQLVQIQASSEAFKKAHDSLLSLTSKDDNGFLRSYRSIANNMETLILSEDRSLLKPLIGHEIPVVVSSEALQRLSSLGAVCGGQTPTDLYAETSHNKSNLLSLSWETGKDCEAKNFEIEFEQLDKDLSSVLKGSHDQHRFSQKEPQYQKVRGTELKTYVDFLCPGYTYKFKVHSQNDAGWGMWSESITAKCVDFPVKFEYTKRIHRICIPLSAHYRITACGAKAADGQNRTGGKGAVISGTFSLKQGDILIFLCGGMSQRHEYSSGGGGGTFVALNDITQDSLLIVAGGGGGTRGRDDDDFDGYDASLNINGTDGRGNEFGRGGCNGDAGEDADSAYFRGPCWGYGGAGVLKNATTADCFPSGGKGGRNGGFGGGGGAGSWGGGGGGGYSGGGGGRGGGGGGSYVKPGATDIAKDVGNDCDGSILVEIADPPYPLSSHTGSSGYVTGESRVLYSFHSSVSSTSSANSKYVSTLSQATTDDMVDDLIDTYAKNRPAGKPIQSIVESHNVPMEYPSEKLPHMQQVVDSGTRSPNEIPDDFPESNAYVSPNSTSSDPPNTLQPVVEVQERIMQTFDEAIYMQPTAEPLPTLVKEMVSNYPYPQPPVQLHSSQVPTRYTEPMHTPPAPVIHTSNSVPVTLDQAPYPPASVIFNNPTDSNSNSDFDLVPNSNANFNQP